MSTDFDFLFYLDWLAKTFVSADGGAPEAFTLTLGDTYNCGVKFVTQSAGSVAEIPKTVRSIKASVGQAMDPPASGKFSLQFTNGVKVGTTDLIDFNVVAADFPTACAAALDGAHADLAIVDVFSDAPSCWVFRLTGAGIVEPVTIERVDNTLRPASFVRVRPFQEDGNWNYEVRLLKSPLVFTGDKAFVLPAPPTIKTINNGSARVPGTTANTNEVQALVIPVDFLGTYHLEWDFRTTRVLGKDDGIDNIASALNEMYGDGLTRFLVTNPVLGEAYIEFTGPLQEADQPEIEVHVDSFPPGILRFTLDCDKEELAAELRAKTTVIDCPFEIEVTVVDDGLDPADITVSGRKNTFQTTTTLRRDGIYDELQAREPIDWQRPPQATSYNPVEPDQVLVGHLNWDMAFGDPSTLHYVFDHELHTSAGYVTLRLEVDGRALGQGTEYLVYFEDDALTVDLAEYPTADDSLVITFLAAGPKAIYQAHTHSIEEVTGLEARLESLESQVSTILDRLPFTTPARVDALTDQQISVTLPDKLEAFPGKFKLPQTDATAPVAPYQVKSLLMAIHDSAWTNLDFSTGVPSNADAAGQVYKSTNAGTILSGVSGFKSILLAVDDLVANDGRGWFRVRQLAGTNSFYPVAMERTLFTLPINEKMLRPGQVAKLAFDLSVAMLATDLAAQWLLVIDAGVARGVTIPAPVGVNLKDILWNTTPILAQPLLLSSILVKTKFGAQVHRAVDNTLTASSVIYGSIEDATAGVPTSPSFVLRGRLIEWDIPDNISDPRGAPFYAMATGLLTIQ